MQEISGFSGFINLLKIFCVFTAFNMLFLPVEKMLWISTACVEDFYSCRIAF